MDTEDAGREMVEKLGQAIVNQDFAAATALTASWLALDEAGWRELVEAEIGAMSEQWGLTGPAWPTELAVDTNPLSFASWIETNESAASYNMKRDIPREITTDNFRKRMKLTLLPEEGAFAFDEWCSFWLAVVDENGELKVGDVEVHHT